MLRRPALIKWLPSPRWRPKTDEQIVSPELHSQYPALAADFRTLEQELLPRFRELDNAALRAQHRFRLLGIILILGGLLATTLGAIQTAGGHDGLPGIAEAVLSALLAAIALVVRDLKPQEDYFTNRLKAELLRGEYFLFVGRIAPYADERLRLRQLRHRIAEIVTGEEEA